MTKLILIFTFINKSKTNKDGNMWSRIKFNTMNLMMEIPLCFKGQVYSKNKLLSIEADKSDKPIKKFEQNRITNKKVFNY